MPTRYLLLVLLVSAVCYGQPTSTGLAKTTGECSPAVTGNKNTFTINCAVDKEQGERMLAILNKILRNQLDPTAVMAKLDEIGKDVKNLSPRRLSEKQIADLQESVKNNCSRSSALINVTASNGNQEAQRYGMDFVNALRAAGCRADLILPIPGLRPDVIGVNIAVRNLKSIDAFAFDIKYALAAAGVPSRFALMEPEFFQPETFVLVIGA
jgi:hypothetical protein